MSKPAFEGLEFTKESFERWVDEENKTVLSDEQWEIVRDELDGRVGNYLDDMIYSVVLDFREGMYDE